MPPTPTSVIYNTAFPGNNETLLLTCFLNNMKTSFILLLNSCVCFSALRKVFQLSVLLFFDITALYLHPLTRGMHTQPWGWFQVADKSFLAPYFLNHFMFSSPAATSSNAFFRLSFSGGLAEHFWGHAALSSFSLSLLNVIFFIPFPVSYRVDFIVILKSLWYASAGCIL